MSKTLDRNLRKAPRWSLFLLICISGSISIVTPKTTAFTCLP
jgi:hypothetical protein